MLPQVRRVLTGHDADGRSTIVADGASPCSHVAPVAGIGGYLLWRPDAVPASNEGNADTADRPFPPEIAPPAGTHFYVFAYPPLSSADDAQREALLHGRDVPNEMAERPGMHRTDTVDYIVMMSGEITFITQTGEVTLRAGDTLVDRGVAHAWENRGTVPAMLASITVAAEPIRQALVG